MSRMSRHDWLSVRMGAKNTNHGRQRCGRRLAFESLEDRRLLAFDTASFSNVLSELAQEEMALGATVDNRDHSVTTFDSIETQEITRSIISGEFVIGIQQDADFLQTIDLFSLNLANSVEGLTNIVTDNVLSLGDSEDLSIEVIHVSYDGNIDLDDMIASASEIDNVIWAAPNYQYSGDILDFTPNDPLFGSQYHHALMGNTTAWDVTLGDPSVVIAVTDEGVELDHPDLAANIWQNTVEVNGTAGVDDDGNGYIDDFNGWDFVTNDNDPNPIIDSDDHGTHVAGIAAGVTNNSNQIAGTAGGASIMPLRIAGNDGGFTSTIMANTFAYAIDNGARITNTSFNINGFVGDPTFTAGLQYYYDNGGLHFNSAGNANELNPVRQAFHQTLLVANTNSSDVKSGTSNYGTGIDIAAPGSSILSTVTSGGTGTKGGTSMAAPNAAGAAALIWSANPGFTRDQVAAQLLGTADNIDGVNPGYVGLLGTGRVNSGRALTETLPSPVISSLSGLPGESGTGGTISSFEIRFDQIMDPASVNAGSNFDLRSPGVNGTFGDADDVVYTLAYADYMIGTNTLVFDISEGLLDLGDYRFTASSGGLQNPFGAALDGDGNGSGGDDFVRSFTIVPTVTVDTLLTNDTTPELTGTVDDPTATISVDVGGQTGVTATNNGDGTWTLPDDTLAALANGTYDVVVTATDTALNVGTDTTTNELTIDTTIISSIFADYFPATTYNPTIWSLFDATIDEVGIDEPSEPYAARFNGTPDGGDQIESVVFDLSGISTLSTVELRYFFQQTGGGESPDSGDDLIVEYVDPSSSWVELERQLGSGPDMTTFQQSIVTLPALALHTNSQIRFRNTASTGAFDDWFVDNIELLEFGDNDPPIVTIDTLLTNDTTPELTGTVDDPTATISVDVGGQTGVTATNNGDGTWTLPDDTLAPLAVGTYDVVVTATDAALNIGTDSTTDELMIGGGTGELHGTKWNDLDGDGVRDAGESGLAGWTVYLDLNANGQLDVGSVTIEPDDHTAGTLLNTVDPAVTLSAIGTSTTTNVYANIPSGSYTSTGSLGFTNDTNNEWWENGVRLRIDFTSPTSAVSIDAIGNDSSDFAVLEAYDSSDNLLDTYNTALVGTSVVETMTITRGTADIAYVIASGLSGDTVNLDNLQFGQGSSEPTAITDVNGDYWITGLAPDDYLVGEVQQPGWEQTFPHSGSNITVAVFDDPVYVDTSGGTGAESDNVQATLASLGFTVNTFTGTTGTDWSTGLAGANVVLIPEQEFGNLAPALEAAAITELQNFVNGGGGLLVHGRGSTGNAANVLNTVFGHSIVEQTVSNGSGPYTLTAAASGTEFADDAATLSANNATSALTTASLPAGASSLYEVSGLSIVTLFSEGSGYAGYLGWDWWDAAPAGTQDNGWVQVLESAVLETAAQNVEGFHQVTLGPGQVVENIDFGNRGTGELHGTKWNDLDGDGVRDAGESGLAGWTVYLDLNANGQLDVGSVTIEPDDHTAGTLLNTVDPAVTLSAIGTSTTTNVYANIPSGSYTSTGSLGFTNDTNNEWWENGVRLRIDFTSPTSAVSIDAIGNDSSDFAVLEAYDSSDNLLDTYNTALVGTSVVETMTITRGTADIAYVIASGLSGDTVNLDNLQFGQGSSEPTAITDVNGDYWITGLAPDDYLVGEVQQPGWEQTFPHSGSNITVAVFDDPVYVDTSGGTGAESDNVQATLASLGFTVNTFTGTTGTDWSTGLAGANVVLVPELENGNLASALDAAAITALQNYVSNGGGLLVHGSGGFSALLLNTVFGYSLSGSAAANTPFGQTGATTGTEFADDALSLPDNSLSYAYDTASLPAGASSMYESGGETVVALMEEGSGEIAFLGWDWNNAAPVGTQDNGWVQVLESAVLETAQNVQGFHQITLSPGEILTGVDFGNYYTYIPTADFDQNGTVNGLDFLAWQRGFGTVAPNATRSDGDADGDLDVDGGDLSVWESQYGIPTADFDQSDTVNGLDFLAWQRGFGTVAPNATRSDGDADGDLDVDGDDLKVWESRYGQAYATPLVAAVSSGQSSEGSGQLIEAASSSESLLVVEASVPLSTIAPPAAAVKQVAVSTSPAATDVSNIGLLDAVRAWQHRHLHTVKPRAARVHEAAFTEFFADSPTLRDWNPPTNSRSVEDVGHSESDRFGSSADVPWLAEELLEKVFS